jgi:hypothetical protein
MTKKPKRVRKPRRLETPVHCYAGLVKLWSDDADTCVYIGGENIYNGPRQIHLCASEVHRLARWLAQASEYLKAREKR